MSKEVYRQLLEVMKKRRGSYASMDIPEFYAMVEELFTEEEAEVNNALPGGPATAEQIAKQMGRDDGQIKVILERMADKGLCRTIKAGNTIHTYDQVQTYIDKYDPISAGACFCRHAAKLLGEDIHGMPTDVCMFFGQGAEFAIERLEARKLTKKEARVLLDQAEDAGLVHMTRNTTEDIEFLCNCDQWHCEVLTSVLKQSRPGLFFSSGFQPIFDPGLCEACETCVERCPAGALTMGENDVPQVDFGRCFGCAICATGCPSEAIAMDTKQILRYPRKILKNW